MCTVEKSIPMCINLVRKYIYETKSMLTYIDMLDNWIRSN